MSTITLRAKNRREISIQELEPLAEALRQTIENVQVSIDEPPEYRVGVGLRDVLEIFLTHADTVITSAITSAVTAWVARRSEQKHEKLSTSVNLYGPDGKVLRRIEIDDPQQPPEIHDEKKD